MGRSFHLVLDQLLQALHHHHRCHHHKEVAKKEVITINHNKLATSFTNNSSHYGSPPKMVGTVDHMLTLSNSANRYVIETYVPTPLSVPMVMDQMPLLCLDIHMVTN